MLKKLIFAMIAAGAVGSGSYLAAETSRISPATAYMLRGMTSRQYAAPEKREAAGERVAVFAHLAYHGAEEELRAMGIEVGSVVAGIATAYLPQSQLAELAASEAITYLEIAPTAHRLMDVAKAMTHTDAVRTGAEGLPQPFTGKGVVVGVIDTGLEYGHANFIDPATGKLRIRRIWNQALAGTPPAGFGYGTEYVEEEEMLNARFDTYEASHGTHVLGIAAGSMNHPEADYSGMAPDADIVYVSLNLNESTEVATAKIIDGIKYIFEFAEAEQKPCVVNLSLGSHEGPHDGTSTFDTMLDAMVGEGRIIVGAAGNEGKYKFHLSEQLLPEEGNALKSFHNFKYASSKYSVVEFWGEVGSDLILTPVIYNNSREPVARLSPAVINGSSGSPEEEWKLDSETYGIAGSMVCTAEINPLNGKPHALLHTSIDNFYDSDFLIGFEVTSVLGGTVHVWSDYYYSTFASNAVEGFSDPDNSCTVGEIGGTAKRIISVGAYVSKPYYKNFGIYYPANDKTEGALAYFSSIGPTADGRVKPEITAPGEFLVSSLSTHYIGTKYRETNYVWNDVKYHVGYMQGTSMSAPLVAGGVALWLEANPELTPENIQEILQSTADNDDFTGAVATTGSPEWGYGKFNTLAGLKKSIELRRESGLGSLETDAISLHILQQSGSLEVIAPASGSPVSLTITDAAGIDRRHATASGSLTLSTSGLLPGIYIARAIAGNSIATHKFVIQ